MDLNAVICELYAEKHRLDQAIASLEELIAAKAGVDPPDVDRYRKPQRGRTNMPPDERRKVSERMKKYWARRRALSPKAAAGVHP